MESFAAALWRRGAIPVVPGLAGEYVTGATAEQCITQNVMERAGLRDTELPSGPHINGPHSQNYGAWFGMIDPPHDSTVYDMSWVDYGLRLHRMKVPGRSTIPSTTRFRLFTS